VAAGAPGPPVSGRPRYLVDHPRYLAEHPRFLAYALTLGGALLCGGAIVVPNVMHPS